MAYNVVFQGLLAQIPNPVMVEHVEKQPEEEHEPERNVRDHLLLEVRSEIILITKFSFLALQHKFR